MRDLRELTALLYAPAQPLGPAAGAAARHRLHRADELYDIVEPHEQADLLARRAQAKKDRQQGKRRTCRDGEQREEEDRTPEAWGGVQGKKRR
jgi:hypothetical protein